MFTLSPSQPNYYLCYSGTLRRRRRPWWAMSYFVWFWNSKLYFIESLSLGGLNHHWRIQHWEDLICHWVSPLISWLLVFSQWFVPRHCDTFYNLSHSNSYPSLSHISVEWIHTTSVPSSLLSPLRCCYIYSLPPQLWQLHLSTHWLGPHQTTLSEPGTRYI